MATDSQENKYQFNIQQNRCVCRACKLEWQRNFLFILVILLIGFSLYKIRRDIINRKLKKHHHRQIERLELLNESKDQLFSIVSHDLRSAVYTLKINLSRLKMFLSENKINEATLLAESSEGISTTTQALLNNLLYWALSQMGQLNYKQEEIELRSLINQVCFDFLTIASSKMVALNNNISHDCFCTGDVNSIKIIFRNIIDNAVKYTPENGSINIFVADEFNQSRITVRDTGIGMDAAMVSTILTNDNRRIQYDTYGRRSTGIGLWLSVNITKKNGGELTITSNQGTGTEVTVRLPKSS